MNRIILTAFGWMAIGAFASGQQEDEVLGRKGSEWVQILRTHKEVKYRRAALIALELIGPRSRGVLTGLFEALEKDEEAEVRRETALLLGRMGPDARGAVTHLLDTLRRDKSAAVRQGAARALGGKLKDQAKDRLSEIVELLKDSDQEVRTALVETVRSFDDAARPALPALLKIARNQKEDRFARLYALQVVSLYGEEHKESLGLLHEIAGDGTELSGLRETAVEGLGRRGEASAAPILAEALKTKDVKIRLAAATALAKLGSKGKEAWPALQVALKDSDATVRLQAIRATGALAYQLPEALAALGAVGTKDEATENCLAAIQELGDLGRRAENALPLLTQLADNDVRGSIRRAAADALKKIQSP